MPVHDTRLWRGLVAAAFGFIAGFMTTNPKTRRSNAVSMGTLQAVFGFVIGIAGS